MAASRRYRKHHDRAGFAGVFAGLAILLGCAPTDGRDPVPRIELRRIASISDSTGMLAARIVLATAHESRLLLPCCAGSGFAVYDTAGRLITTVGKRGSGLGEFQFAGAPLIGPGDTVHVGDARLGRISVFSPDYQFIRTVAPAHPRMQPQLVRSDGRYLVARQIPTPSEAGYPMHVLGPDGALHRSFGADTAQYRPDLARFLDRAVGRGSDGSVWAFPPGRYLLEQWDPDSARLLRRLSVAPAWFRESPFWPPDETQRPVPSMGGVVEDGNGVLWVLIRDAATDWEAPPRANTERAVSRSEYDRTYDWVLEAVASEDGRVLASRRFNSPLYLNSASGLITSSRDSTGATVIWDVWLPILRPEEKQP